MSADKPERAQRRLAAILAADVAGYSRLMGTDEEGTLAALKAIRRELGDPKIAEHRGRIVKTTGDGMLVEFQSVVDAVRCAVAVQQGMAARNAAAPEERRIEFRIGINLGDIISDDNDIYGDGVNVAARLEALAEPGGICVSRVVDDQVRDKLDVVFDDQGEQQVKNIARPVHVFRIGPRASGPRAPTLPSPASGGGLGRGAAGTAAVPGADAPLALPDKPSLAVLPFQNMSGDPEQEYFADGMVEEITTAIARLPWLFVIARNSSFTYKGRAVDVKQVARELGVRYVLEGSVRKAGNRVRITGQLIDTATGAHIWAERFDGALDDIFELQDQVASSVAGAIEPKLRHAEIGRASRKPTGSLNAYDLYLRALAKIYPHTEEGFVEAVSLLDQALTIDPSYAPAAALFAYCRTQQQAAGYGALSQADIAEAIARARQALDAPHDDPDTMWQAGWALFRLAGETALAMATLDRALALNPNAASAWGVKGFVHARRNQPEAAIDALNRSLRLSPFDPIGYYNFVGLAVAHLAAQRFETAIEWADRALHQNPRLLTPNQIKIVANANLGRPAEARAEVARIMTLDPKMTIARFRAVFALSMAPESLEFYVDGLRKAGLPEE